MVVDKVSMSNYYGFLQYYQMTCEVQRNNHYPNRINSFSPIFAGASHLRSVLVTMSVYPTSILGSASTPICLRVRLFAWL